MVENLDELLQEAVKQSGLKTDSSTEKKEEQKDETSNKTIFERLKEKGIDVKSEEELEKELLSLHAKQSEYTTKESEYKQKLQEYDGYKDVLDKGLDPLQYFSGDEKTKVTSYKREKLKEAFPNLTTEVADKVVSVDLSTLSPEEKIAIGLKIKYPDLSDSDIKAMIQEDYGDEEERTDAKKARLKVDAAESVNEILKLRSSIKEPEKIDLKVLREQKEKESTEFVKKIEQDWTRESESVLMKNFTITDKVDGKDTTLFSIDVEEDFNKKARQEVIEYFKSNKIPVTKESVEFAKKEIYEMYWRENREKIMKLYAKQEVDKAVETERKANVGMGHVSRKSDGSQTNNEITQEQVDNIISGTDGDSKIRRIKY